jgi:predicted Zn-dependent peptidase
MNYKKIKSPTPMASFYVVYYGSVMNERPGIYGISHLLEHLVCKGIDEFMENFETEAIHWNAYTTDSYIVFYMTGMDKKVKKWKKKFFENLQKFNITEDTFQNEKKIIIEEYKDSFNKQSDSHMQNLFRKLYDNYGAIGLLEDLEKLTLKDCQDFFELQYRRPSFIIDISRSTDKTMEEFFNNVEYDNKTYDKKLEFKINEDFIYEKGNKYKDKTSIIDISPIIYEDFPYVEFITRMLGSGLKSPLYQEMRDRSGLVYYIHCYCRNFTNNSSIVVFVTETSNGNLNKVQSIIKDIIDNPDKYLTKKRFDIIKKYYKNKFEKENIMIHNNGYKFIELEHFLVEKIISTLTYEDIRRVYDKYFHFDMFYQSNDKEEFKDR